ncbi:GbsR/MarR family transcriptional regulator [Reinekea sp.]|jgi:DNA-binding transcriptional regulator GbsR (MarR family)|uniref:GbsR/MarR family transcriptional regulator n=1 Tax=Reinekea sp. TaxID=1970455 RepID=UPI003989541E
MEVNEAETRFIELMGVVSQRNGSPRISGRIFGLLILTGSSMSLQDITSVLKISKASASTNTRLLSNQGVIRLTTLPGERQDYYELVPNPLIKMTEKASLEMSDIAGQVREAKSYFQEEQADVIHRLAQLESFYTISANVLADISSKLDKLN